jgi:hypothetical protein
MTEPSNLRLFDPSLHDTVALIGTSGLAQSTPRHESAAFFLQSIPYTIPRLFIIILSTAEVKSDVLFTTTRRVNIFIRLFNNIKLKKKAIPVTGRGGL